NGNSGQNSAVVTVADASLTSPNGFSINSTEGQTFNGQVTTFQYGNLAVGSGYFTASINWNTATNTNVTVGRVVADPLSSGLFDVFGTNFYGEYGNYPISVTITDLPGTVLTVTGTAMVGDAPLFTTPATVVGVAGTQVSGLVASFTDSNPVGVLS